MKHILLLMALFTILPQTAVATNATGTHHDNRDIAIFFTNSIRGETEPCG